MFDRPKPTVGCSASGRRRRRRRRRRRKRGRRRRRRERRRRLRRRKREEEGGEDEEEEAMEEEEEEEDEGIHRAQNRPSLKKKSLKTKLCSIPDISLAISRSSTKPQSLCLDKKVRITQSFMSHATN